MNRVVLNVVVLMLLCLSGIPSPAAATTETLPPSLKPWQSWVLHGKEKMRCPAHFDDATRRICWWPSRLNLDAGDQGGLFDQQVTVYAATWVTLPGDVSHWPESVFSGAQPLPVTDRDGRPCVWLEPGDYRIRGALVWDPLPDMIQVPASVGIVALTIKGREIDAPDLDADGRLRFHGRRTAVRAEDAMTASVFRLVEDDIPMRVVTRIMLNVSGRPRELRLAVRLPGDAVVMDIDSPLPSRLAGNGDLLVQARPGRWDIRVTERLTGPVTSLPLPEGKAPFGEEIWSFKAFNHLRMVNVKGAPPIDPSRTRMPDEWEKYPAYVMTPGSTLVFDVLRRGDPAPAPDQLQLQRSWWLDFDGAGFTVHDRIEGTLSRTWHLAMPAPMELGRAAVNGEDQLITLQGDTPASPGIQLRRGRLVMEADSRLPRESPVLPAVGWDHDFQQVRGTLHLPPGWTLFSAAGVDVPPGAWLQRWSLLDFFLVLIIAVSTYKLRGPKTAILILATLILIFHEPGAPRLVWLHLLAAAALLRYLPRGWFRRLVTLWGAGAAIALILICLPFMAGQVRNAIYPQLDQPRHGRGYPQRALDVGTADEAVRSAVSFQSTMDKRADRQAEQRKSSPPPDAAKSLTAEDPDALIQTGPGLPAWRWQSVQLRWNGPVDHTQQIRFWLISPFTNLILGLIRVALMLFCVWAFLDLRNWRRHLPQPAAAGVSTLVLAAWLLAPWAPVHAADAGDTAAGFPPQQLLDQLQQRLLAPAPCHPHCADVSRLELAATPDQLRLILQVHALAETAIPLPATLQTWRPRQVMLDNEVAESLARDDQGNLWMVLPQGVHRIKMTGPTGDADEIRISFPLVPHVGSFAGVGWQARGFRPDAGMESTISLSRTKAAHEPPDNASRTDIPAFFHVTRTLHLGIQWEVTTRIERLTETGEPVVLSVPLLKDASLTTDGIVVKDRAAQIAMAPHQTEARFSAAIPISPSILLTAPEQVPWTETWILDAASIWRCTITGLTAVAHQDAAQNWQPRWRPWPGEQATIRITRPEAVPGRTKTIDNARLTLTPGRRSSRSELTLGIRSSRGGHHQIELPEMANLQTVAVNGTRLPIRQDGRLVRIPMEPGSQHVEVKWHAPTHSMTMVKGPAVNIGDAAVNASVTFRMPDHRWILFAGGPRLGPAVLFWSYVIVVIIAAIALGKTDLTPLGTFSWMLLGLGLTQAPLPVAALVVGWLLALGFRCRQKGPDRPLVFNLMQLFLAAVTLAALAGLYLAVERGLLGIPDMQIAGNHSTQTQLQWYQDRINGTLPVPWVISLPQWSYHLLMLGWSLWLAFSLIAWLRWGWGCFSKERLWKPMRLRKKGEHATVTKPDVTG